MLLTRFKTLLKGNFLRNILVLMTGTASVQLMNFLITPIITRLYSPEAFGALGLFSSTITFTVVAVTLSYPIALVIERRDRNVEDLTSVCIKLIIINSLIAMIAVFVISKTVNFLSETITLYLAIALTPASLVVLYTQLLLRERKFKFLALVSFVSALTVGLMKISFGFWFPSDESLLYAAVAGFWISLIPMHLNLNSMKIPIKMPFIRTKELVLLKVYRQFPIYRTPQALNTSLSQIIPVTLLTYYFGLVEAGLYTLTRSVLMAPVTLLGKAVYDVALPQVSRDFHKKPIFKFILTVTISLSLISIIPIIILFMWGEYLFSFVFGDDWSRSGVYASCMSYWFLLNICNRPSVAAVPSLNLDKFLLKNSFVNSILSTFSFVFFATIYNSDEYAILGYFGAACFAQFTLIVFVHYNAYKSDIYKFNTIDVDKVLR